MCYYMFIKKSKLKIGAKMKRKFTIIIMAVLMLSMSVLTGCSLITRNWEKYYNAVVSTIIDQDKNKIEITKRDLITAYNSYGYYFEQYYGQTREEAVKSTLEQLESRKLTIRASEKMFKEKNGNDQILTDKEKAYLWKETSDALEENFMSYVNQVTGTTSKEEEEDDSAIKFNSYEKQAILNEQNVIEKVKGLDELLSDFEFDPANAKDIANPEDKKLIYDNLVKLVMSTSGNVYSKAFNEYRKALERSEEGLTSIKDKTVTALFDREIDRIYKVLYDNFMIEKYSDSFKDKSTTSNVTNSKLLELYTNKVLSSYNQYVLEGDSEYENNVLSGLKDIYYFKDGQNDTKFYTVSHVLFKFSDAQTEQYNKAKSDLEAGRISINVYNEKMDALYDAITPTVRAKDSTTGIYNEVEDKDLMVYERSAKTLYEEIKYQVEHAGDGLTDKNQIAIAKAEKFNEFIYKYNEDPGIMNAEFNYVMGVNKSQATEDDFIELADGRRYKSYSQMVSEFTLAGAELYNDGEGQIGDLSGMVMTENGIHIMMYTGECKNLFDIIVNGVNGVQVALGDGAIQTLYTERLNVCVDKTIFDKLYDELNTDNFSTFENANILVLRENCQFKRNQHNYKDLFKV